MNPKKRTPSHPDAALTGRWYHQPVLWIGALLFAASLAGCVLMIVLGVRHPDVPLPIAGGEVMHMPLGRAPAPDDPAKAAQ